MRMRAGGHFKENFLQNKNLPMASLEWSRKVEIRKFFIFSKISKLDPTMHLGWFENRKQDFNWVDKRFYIQHIYTNLELERESDRLTEPAVKTFNSNKSIPMKWSSMGGEFMNT